MIRCRICRKRRATKDMLSCKPCRDGERERQEGMRNQRLNSGLCSRCGIRKHRPGRKYCRKCLTIAADVAADLHNSRRAERLCPKCGEPAAIKLWPDGRHRPMKQCDSCLEQNRINAVGRPKQKRDPAKLIEAVNAWRRRQRELGNCIKCGKPAYYDPVQQVIRRQCRYHLDLLK